MSVASLDAATVRQAAQGRWYSILPALSISVPNHPRKHAPCPTCGGKDRFRFDDRDGLGTWFCNQCAPHAGDGFALVMNAQHIPFREVLVVVASVLGLDSALHTGPRRPLPQLPVRVDRRARAFLFELGALDRRLRAERVFASAGTIGGDDLTDEVRDRLMTAVASAYTDLDRADLLEHVADSLRAKDFHEKMRTP